MTIKIHYTRFNGLHNSDYLIMYVTNALKRSTPTGDWRRQRTWTGDELPAGQGGRESGVRGHKRGGRQGDGGRDQRRAGGRGRGSRLLHDQRGRAEPGERTGQSGGREMGQGGRADQQRGYCGQRAVDGHHRRSDQAHDRRQPGLALLGECRNRIPKSRTIAYIL